MEALIGMEDAAELIGFPVATLRHWRRTNQGPPAAKVGRRVVYRKSDIEAWISSKFDEVSA